MSLPDSNTSNTPDYDIDIQPHDLSRRMQHLSNALNHFWKRWRNEYLLELRNAHRYFGRDDASRAASIGDVVVVHEKDKPRGKWRVGKILDIIAGSDGCIRGAVVQVRSKGGNSTMLRHLVQRLYPLEIQSQVPIQDRTPVLLPVKQELSYPCRDGATQNEQLRLKLTEEGRHGWRI